MPQPLRGTPAGRRQQRDPADALAELAAAAPDWVAYGLCARVDPEVFFPPKGASAEPAKGVCRSCAVRPQCLDYALANRERHGVWGGLSEPERRALLRNQTQSSTLAGEPGPEVAA
jgi:WhiB family redox-sensing transcriptional regulator